MIFPVESDQTNSSEQYFQQDSQQIQGKQSNSDSLKQKKISSQKNFVDLHPKLSFQYPYKPNYDSKTTEINQNDVQSIKKNEKQKSPISISNCFPQFEHQFSTNLFLNNYEKSLFLNSKYKMINIIRDRKDKLNSAYYEYLKNKKELCEQELQKGIERQSKEIKETRSKMRILIIIGSQLLIKYNSKDAQKLLSGYEDFSLAFFLRNIFHFCYGLDYSQILITSSDEKAFPTDKTVIQRKKYKSPTEFLNKSEKQSSDIQKNKNENLASFENGFLLDFWREKLITSQVGREDFKYICESDISSLILPLNSNSLKLLNSKEDSELFIFYLDHSNYTYVSGFVYEYFLECLNDMKFSHATIINDVSHSGFLVDLFKSCEIFESIIHLPFLYIPNNQTRTNEKSQKLRKTQETKEEITSIYNIIQAFSSEKQRQIQILLFNLFLQYSFWEKSNKLTEIQEERIQKLPSSSFGKVMSHFQNIDDEVNDIVTNIVLNVINNQKFHPKEKIQSNFHNALIAFSNLFREKDIFIIDPQIVNSLKEKVSILSSCKSREIPSALPLRKDIYLPKDYPVKACGTIYMSAVINYLLHPTFFGNDTIEDFNYKINKELQRIKKDFYLIVKDQNNPNKLTFFKESNIPPFFNRKYQHIIPFSKIILPNRITFFEKEEVNPKEYENIQVKDYLYIM